LSLRFALLVAVSLSAFGCRPRVGSSCEKGEARCVDGQSALVCQDGKFIETPCRGKNGCRLEAEQTACDVHGNRAGDACSTDEEGSAVCLDASTLLSCHKGAYVSSPCRGKNGCVEENGRSACDATIAEPGESCVLEGKKACSVDGKRVLACVGGKLENNYECRGARGCSVVMGKLDCDISIARLGDACDKTSEGTFACSEDLKAITRCAGGRFVADETCKRGTKCLAEPGSTRCAKPD
jgi:hypothetical protein